MNQSSKIPVVVTGLLLVLAVTFFTYKNLSDTWNFFIAEVPTTPLKVGTNKWFGYQPLYLAQSLGYFEGNSVRLVDHASATQVIRAFRNNTIDVATLTLDEALLLLEVGLGARIILVVDISNGGDVIIAKPEIASLSELKGHTVGVESNALGAYFITRALESVGLGVSDVDIIDSDIDQHENMFLKGAFDAVVTYEPVRSHLLAMGTHEVFDSSKIPGEIVDVLVVSDQALELYPEKIKALLEGWFRALNYIKAQPEVAAVQMGPRLNMSAEEVLVAYKDLIWPDQKENLRMMAGPEAPLLKTANKLADIMLKQNLLQQKFTPKLFTTTLTLMNIEESLSKTLLK